MGIKSSRKWLLTINNPSKHGCTHENIKVTLSQFKSVKYWCICDEIGGKTKTYHTHIYLYSPTPVKFATVKNRFPSSHIDFCRGSSQENRDYIRKEGKYQNSDKLETNLKDTFEEFGEFPEEHQGRRNDLNFLYDCIKDGMSNYEILELNPEYIMQIEKIDRCREICRYEKFKNSFRNLEVSYHFGKTGKGKTRMVMERFGYENVYRVTDYIHPFDNYKGQDVIVFEEFRSSLKIQDMLNYLDGYPLDLPCRYNNKIACFTKIYILSNIPLEKQYIDIQKQYEEIWMAFLRRISCVKEFSDNGIVDYANTDEYINRWHTAHDSDIPFNEKYEQEKMELINDWINYDDSKKGK